MSEPNHQDRASDPTPVGGTVVAETTVSKAGAAVTVTDIKLSTGARRALNIGAVRLEACCEAATKKLSSHT